MKIIYLILIFGILTTNINDDYYTILGVGKDATKREIKKAFRSLSLKYHPDRNPGNKEAHDLYVKITKAQEVLLDDNKRKIYDLYGEEGLEKEQNLQNRPRQKGPTAIVEYKVSLEELYTGNVRKFNFNKKVECPHCHGTGGKPGKTKQCPQCNGRGAIIQNVNMMGFIMQMNQPCGRCHGTGVIFTQVCDVCHGSKITREPSEIDINIEKGAKDGQEIIYPGKGEVQPDMMAGDLLVILRQSENGSFKRIDNNLETNLHIGLKEALFGFNKNITHLDKRLLNVKSDSVIQPFQTIKIKKEGMPMFRREGEKGDLFIKMFVDFPTSITEDERKIIEKLEL